MNRFSKIMAWTKFIIFLCLILAALLVILMNHGNKARLWLFHSFGDVSVLWLIVVTAVASIVGWKIIGGVWRAYGEIRRSETESARSENKQEKTRA